MHLVDDVDLVASLHGGVAHAVQQLAHVVDAGPRGRVELQHVHVPALDDRLAVAALGREVHGRPVHALGVVVQGAGEQPGGGGLADPPNAGEHEGVGDPPRGEGVAQGPDHGLLADQVLEGAWPVLARQHLIGPAGRRRRAGVGFGRAEHVGRVLVALGGVWDEREFGVGHGIGRVRVETGRRPEAKLVTAASFRT